MGVRGTFALLMAVVTLVGAIGYIFTGKIFETQVLVGIATILLVLHGIDSKLGD